MTNHSVFVGKCGFTKLFHPKIFSAQWQMPFLADKCRVTFHSQKCRRFRAWRCNTCPPLNFLCQSVCQISYRSFRHLMQFQIGLSQLTQKNPGHLLLLFSPPNSQQKFITNLKQKPLPKKCLTSLTQKNYHKITFACRGKTTFIFGQCAHRMECRIPDQYPNMNQKEQTPLKCNGLWNWYSKKVPKKSKLTAFLVK